MDLVKAVENYTNRMLDVPTSASASKPSPVTTTAIYDSSASKMKIILLDSETVRNFSLILKNVLRTTKSANTFLQVRYRNEFKLTLPQTPILSMVSTQSLLLQNEVYLIEYKSLLFVVRFRANRSAG